MTIKEHKMKYLVIEQHYGDRQYWAGDERDVKDPETAAYLIEQRLIAPLDGEAEQPDAKADAAPQNKAAKPPKNKAGK